MKRVIFSILAGLVVLGILSLLLDLAKALLIAAGVVVVTGWLLGRGARKVLHRGPATTEIDRH